MCHFREYHIVTLLLFIKCLAFLCGVRGEYRSTLGITCAARLGLRTAGPGHKSTSKVMMQQPGIRMLDYDLKLQFTLKTKT